MAAQKTTAAQPTKGTHTKHTQQAKKKKENLVRKLCASLHVANTSLVFFRRLSASTPSFACVHCVLCRAELSMVGWVTVLVLVAVVAVVVLVVSNTAAGAADVPCRPCS